MQEVASPVYGERNVILRYRVCDLLWRPAGLLVRFVAVIHPTRGACLLMCTDTSLCAIEIIRIYGLRFKIELCFKQAMRLIGTFAYHFWMRDMTPLRYRNGNQYLHRKSVRYQKHVIGKIHAYHVFIQAGVVAQQSPDALRRHRLRVADAHRFHLLLRSFERCPTVFRDVSRDRG